MIIALSTSFVSAFLASFLEAVEALTIVQASGSTRVWRSALSGAAFALLLLAGLTALGGPFLTLLPTHFVRLVLGLFLFVLGFLWLRKAILRAAGILPPREEALTYSQTEDWLRIQHTDFRAFDRECFVVSFYGVLIEGMEVVFIVLSLGAAGNTLLAASSGAGVACVSVMGLGWLLHRPLTKIPENGLRFLVGILLSSFGLLWIAEGLTIPWLVGETALPRLFVAVAILAALCGAIGRRYFRQ